MGGIWRLSCRDGRLSTRQRRGAPAASTEILREGVQVRDTGRAALSRACVGAAARSHRHSGGGAARRVQGTRGSFGERVVADIRARLVAGAHSLSIRRNDAV